MQSPSRSEVVLFGPALIALASCGGGGGGGGSTPPPDLSGTISVFSTTSVGGGVTLENEPNDDFASAELLGAFAPGRSSAIRGHADAESDPIDAFRITTTGRVRFDVRVRPADSGALDADLLVYDTTSSQIVEAFPSIVTSGGASFHAKGSLLVVLCAHGGSSAYTMAIRATEPTEPLVANAGPGSRYLGEMLAGETTVLRGSTKDSTTAPVRLLVACPENVDFGAELVLGSGAEGELAILDATAGLSTPTEVVRVRGAAPAVIPGVPAMSLLAIGSARARPRARGARCAHASQSRVSRRRSFAPAPSRLSAKRRLGCADECSITRSGRSKWKRSRGKRSSVPAREPRSLP
jgi:hypothetical protein